ncbi:MAG: membrane integrity-associated transporter subunit PqiC [Planctomycetes bacterium]|nr:membrane integrity-associated transporter subunit PqiC [Planctomycetota bacterium]
MIRTSFPLALALLLFSCGTTAPSRFYLVSSPAAASQAPTESTGPLIALEIVDVPAYLERDPIATRTSSHELSVADFDRWAEPIEEALRRVIAETFESKGANLVFPGGEREAALFLRLELTALDGVLGGDLELRARWSVRRGSETPLLAGRIRRTESTGGDASYAAWAAATSRAFQGLAQDLVQRCMPQDAATP